MVVLRALAAALFTAARCRAGLLPQLGSIGQQIIDAGRKYIPEIFEAAENKKFNATVMDFQHQKELAAHVNEYHVNAMNELAANLEALDAQVIDPSVALQFVVAEKKKLLSETLVEFIVVYRTLFDSLFPAKKNANAFILALNDDLRIVKRALANYNRFKPDALLKKRTFCASLINLVDSVRETLHGDLLELRVEQALNWMNNMNLVDRIRFVYEQREYYEFRLTRLQTLAAHLDD